MSCLALARTRGEDPTRSLVSELDETELAEMKETAWANESAAPWLVLAMSKVERRGRNGAGETIPSSSSRRRPPLSFLLSLLHNERGSRCSAAPVAPLLPSYHFSHRQPLSKGTGTARAAPFISLSLSQLQPCPHVHAPDARERRVEVAVSSSPLLSSAREGRDSYEACYFVGGTC